MKKTIENNNGNINLSKIVGTFLVAFLFMMGTPSFAQEIESENVGNTEVDEFAEYDANQDQQWDRDEFDTRMGESETFNQWDTDLSGDIDENEYNEGISNWEDQQKQDYTEADDEVVEDNTGIIENTEEYTETTEPGAFQDWDADQSGTIDQNEFNEGVYNEWDTDRDGVLNNEEYNEGINQFEAETETDTGLMDETENEVEIGTEEETEIGTEEETEIGTEEEMEIGTEEEVETETEIGTEEEVETEY